MAIGSLFDNELEYVEFKLGVTISKDNYILNEKRELTYLDLSYWKSINIEFLIHLSSIVSLNLSRTNFTNINVLSKLKSLEILDISNNEISDIEFLSEFSCLKEINISSNSVKNIDVLVGLVSLESINISNNPISSSSIYLLKDMPFLKKLYLANLNLKGISFLKNMKNLLELGIAENPIEDISLVKGMVNLRYLNIANMPKLEDFTPISSLMSLEYLSIRDNKIENLSILKKMTSLKTLSISNAGVKDIFVISKLSSLEKLYLQNNEIDNIFSISNLTSLTVLNLENNLINDISSLSGLTSLTILILSNNLINDISSLLNLSSIIRLYLNNNQIYDIKALSNLTSLEVLRINRNPIKNVPETILKSSAQEIVRWLQENEKAKERKIEKVLLKDVKILLLGNTNIGKSNLLFYWQQWYVENEIKTEYPEKSDSTHGLVYKELQKDKNAPLLHIWDFGGQEYFHATHQLFFSPDALHVLLWSKGELDTRIKQEEVFELDYWLRCSEQLSKDESPIEMVLIENRIDHTDENDKLEFYSHFPDARYLEKFNIYSPHEETDSTKPPFMLNTCSVSLLHQKRLQGMFELLEERIDMLHQKNLHPPKYAEIRDVLDESKRKYWTLNQYKKRFGEDDGIILQTLHRLGCLLYFHEQLPNKIFTQPALLLNLIYDDILNKHLQKNNGKLSNELIVAAQNKDLKLTVSELETLLSAFKLIFKAQDDCWYAPQYLPEEAPAWLTLLKQHTFSFPNIIVSSDQYLMNSILLDIFQEYGDIIKKDASYLFWQKGLVIEKEEQLLLVEYDRQKMRLLLYGDQQGNNKNLQQEVVEFISKKINKFEKSYDVLKFKYKNFNWLDINERYFKPIIKSDNFKWNDIIEADFKSIIRFNNDGIDNWNVPQINHFIPIIKLKNNDLITENLTISASVDGKYYVSIQKLNEHVANEMYSIKAFHIEDNTQLKTFSVFRFNQYLDNEHQGTMKKVAISYSKDDLKLVNEFKKSLIPLQDDGLIASPIWYCTDLKAGTEWDKEIKENFEAADMIFFMVSPNFLATNYIKEHEIKTAIEKRTRQVVANIPTSEQLKIIPIILDHCSWKRKDKTMNLGQYNALPYTAKPVMDFDNRNKAWFLTTDSIRIAIEHDNDPNFSLDSSKEIQKLRERLIEGYLDKNSKT